MTADTDKEQLLVPLTNKCLICNVKVGASARGSCNIFHRNVVTASQKQLAYIIATIVECEILEGCVHSQVVCKKCYKLLIDFDDLEVKLTDLKQEIVNKYQKTLKCQGFKKGEQSDKPVSCEIKAQEQNDKTNLPLNEDHRNVIAKPQKEKRRNRSVKNKKSTDNDNKKDEQKVRVYLEVGMSECTRCDQKIR